MCVSMCVYVDIYIYMCVCVCMCVYTLTLTLELGTDIYVIVHMCYCLHYCIYGPMICLVKLVAIGSCKSVEVKKRSTKRGVNDRGRR